MQKQMFACNHDLQNIASKYDCEKKMTVIKKKKQIVAKVLWTYF